MLAADGWLGIAMPEAYGGGGLGITEAAIMMQAIAESGAGMAGASAVHMNIFGLNPVVVFGTPEQKRRMLPPLIAGKEKACFAVTEPNAGLETARIATRAVRGGDHYVINAVKVDCLAERPPTRPNIWRRKRALRSARPPCWCTGATVTRANTTSSATYAK